MHIYNGIKQNNLELILIKLKIFTKNILLIYTSSVISVKYTLIALNCRTLYPNQ